MIKEILFYYIPSLFYKVLYLTAIGSIVGIFIYCIRNIFDKKISGKLKCIMWCIVLISLLIPIRFDIKTNNAPIIQNEIASKVEYLKNITEYKYIEKQIQISEENIKELDSKELVKQNPEQIDNTTKNTHIKKVILNIIIPYVWLAGASILILIFINGIFKINKKISKNIYKNERIQNILEECKNSLKINKKVKVILQKYKNVPSIFGIISPSILITEQTIENNDENIKYIFLHELAHYKRKDAIFNYILLCVLSIHWFNPIIWFLFDKIRQDIEIGADELASKKLNENEKKAYGMVLINLLKNRQEENYTANMLCMSDTGKNMKRRISQIKEKSKNRILGIVICVAAIIITFMFAFINITNRDFNIANLSNKTNITEDERKNIEEYMYKICNEITGIVPEFKDINEADKYWIYSHLRSIGPRKPEYYTEDPFDHLFPHSTKSEIEEDISNLFGPDLIVNLEKDMESNEDLLGKSANITYREEQDVYEFIPYGWDITTYYAIDTIEKENNEYNLKVVEYFETGDLEEKYPNGLNLLIYKYNEPGNYLGKELFTYEYQVGDSKEKIKKELDKEVLKRKEEFRTFNITLKINENGNIYLKSIERST